MRLAGRLARPSRKAPEVPLGSANQVNDRYLTEGQEGWHLHTGGVVDVLVQNNYAEYGVVLCWGNKGRQVVIAGNIARFMWDYSYGAEGGENHIFSNNISVNSAVAGIMSLYWGEKMLVAGNLVIVRHEPFDPALADFPFEEKGKVREAHPETAFFGQFLRFHHGPPNPEDIYGTGSSLVTGNLFVNELANRPSSVSIENGRDMMLSGNNLINGMIRAQCKAIQVKLTADDTDEFASSDTLGEDEEFRVERRITDAQANRVTITGNEFISRQPGDKSVLIMNGGLSSVIVRDNVFRKESSHIRFTPEQVALEQSDRPRYMLYAVDRSSDRELSNARPEVAITLAASSPVYAILQGNIIQGWKRAIVADASQSRERTPVFVVTGNSTEGKVEVDSHTRTAKPSADGNLKLTKTSS